MPNTEIGLTNTLTFRETFGQRICNLEIWKSNCFSLIYNLNHYWDIDGSSLFAACLDRTANQLAIRA